MFSGSSSPPADPLAAGRRRFALLLGAAAVVLAPIGVWAFRPLVPPALVEPSHGTERLPPSPTAPVEDLAALDRAPFEKNLWWELPKPDALIPSGKTAPAAPASSIEVDLIGVSEVDGVLVAALFDRRANRLRLVRDGDAIADASVAAITRDSVRLARGDAELVLHRRRESP